MTPVPLSLPVLSSSSTTPHSPPSTSLLPDRGAIVSFPVAVLCWHAHARTRASRRVDVMPPHLADGASRPDWNKNSTRKGRFSLTRCKICSRTRTCGCWAAAWLGIRAGNHKLARLDASTAPTHLREKVWSLSFDSCGNWQTSGTGRELSTSTQQQVRQLCFITRQHVYIYI